MHLGASSQISINKQQIEQSCIRTDTIRYVIRCIEPANNHQFYIKSDNRPLKKLIKAHHMAFCPFCPHLRSMPVRGLSKHQPGRLQVLCLPVTVWFPLLQTRINKTTSLQEAAVFSTTRRILGWRSRDAATTYLRNTKYKLRSPFIVLCHCRD